MPQHCAGRMGSRVVWYVSIWDIISELSRDVPSSFDTMKCSAVPERRAQSAECRVVSCEVEMGREGNNLLAQASCTVVWCSMVCP